MEKIPETYFHCKMYPGNLAHNHNSRRWLDMTVHDRNGTALRRYDQTNPRHKLEYKQYLWNTEPGFANNSMINLSWWSDRAEC